MKAFRQKEMGDDLNNIVGFAPEIKFQDFLHNDTIIQVAKYTLAEECATIIGEAAEVHPIFQVFVTGVLTPGSPSIILYMLWNIITINGVVTLWNWLPRQIPIFQKWFVSGMVKPLNLHNHY